MKPNKTNERLPLPGMVLIGSYTRNAGKTTLACRLIEHWKETLPVVGLKVVCIDEGRAHCPKGNEGCGICLGLSGPYDCRKETGENPGKDTARMRDAGAEAYLLRCRKDAVRQGLGWFLAGPGKGALVVCESNSIGLHVKPGVFLFSAGQLPEEAEKKPSALRAEPFVDRVVLWEEGLPKLRVNQAETGPWVTLEQIKT